MSNTDHSLTKTTPAGRQDQQPGLLQVGLLQQRAKPDAPANLERIEAGCREAAAAGCRLVLLQELHQGPYFCQHEQTAEFDRAEPIPGPSTERLGRLASELALVIVASLFERRAAGVYHNTAVVLDADGRLAGRYRKMHIPEDPGFQEKFYFTPGDLGFTPIETSVGRLGVLVCWDQWFPEAARLMALAGADLLLYPTAIGWDPEDDPAEQARQLDAWVTVQRGHAIANGLPVLACNRVGLERMGVGYPTLDQPDETETAPKGDGQHQGHATGIRFWGNSFVCGPQGEILARAASEDESLLIATLDLAWSESVRRIWPFARDRRIDAYQDLTRRWRD